jgi:parvulin-like peptidyl-prolyl isomerase
MVERVREREVVSRIRITDAEIDELIEKRRVAAGASAQVNIAQILVTVPEGAAESRRRRAARPRRGGAEARSRRRGLRGRRPGDLGGQQPQPGRRDRPASGRSPARPVRTRGAGSQAR